MLAALAAMNDSDLEDAWFQERIREIESGIRTAGNRTKHAMNNALIAIGLRNGRLEKAANNAKTGCPISKLLNAKITMAVNSVK